MSNATIRVKFPSSESYHLKGFSELFMKKFSMSVLYVVNMNTITIFHI